MPDIFERQARAVAHSIPPCDFGSTVAIQAVAIALREAYRMGKESRTVDADMIRSALESRATDDEGEFPPLFELLDFSGSNKARTVVEAALRAALDASPTGAQP